MKAFPAHTVTAREVEPTTAPVPIGLLSSGVLLFAVVVALAVVLLQAS